jgi:hypothetical protein
MLNELALRRRNFMSGLPIQLADGQPWEFPIDLSIATSLPDEHSVSRSSDEVALRTEVRALLEAVATAEDEHDRLKSELALAICLLTRNYHLEASDLQELLECGAGDPRTRTMQQSFHELAELHLRCRTTDDLADTKAHESGGLLRKLRARFNALRVVDPPFEPEA